MRNSDRVRDLVRKLCGGYVLVRVVNRAGVVYFIIEDMDGFEVMSTRDGGEREMLDLFFDRIRLGMLRRVG